MAILHLPHKDISFLPREAFVMVWTITSQNFQTLKGRESAYLIGYDLSQTQIMCFSKSNLISSCTVCLWPQNYQNSVATPCTLTSCATNSQKQSPQWDTEEICSSFYHLFYDSSLSSGSYVLPFLLPSFFSPSLPEAFLLSYSSFHFLYPPNTSLQVCFF